MSNVLNKTGLQIGVNGNGVGVWPSQQPQAGKYLNLGQNPLVNPRVGWEFGGELMNTQGPEDVGKSNGRLIGEWLGGSA